MPTIKSLLKYYPIQIGDTKIIFSEKDNEFQFTENNNNWMGYQLDSFWQATEFNLELKYAKGVCITTGLGLGIIQTHLLANENVSKVVVYERNPNTIEIFHKIIEYNNFDITRLVIVNKDANNMSGEKCDCLFLDHYANESEADIVRSVKKISENNDCELLWYWPGVQHLVRFTLTKQLDLDNESYTLWKNYTGIKNLPDSLSDEDLLLVKELKDVYITKVPTPLGIKLSKLEDRNKMLEKFRNRRTNK